MNEKTKDQKSPAVEIRKISFDGIMPWEDVQLLTGLSRPTIWRLEREGRFPARVQISSNRVGWYGHEIKAWLESRPRVGISPCEIESGATK